MLQNISIKKAEQGDADILVRFNMEMAFETEQKQLALPVVSEGVRAILTNPQYGFYLVAKNHDTVVGALMITYEWSDWRNKLYWWIQSVYIEPNFRRQGIYRKLYETVKALAAREKNVYGVRLYVDQNNLNAQKTYHALGMAPTHYLMYEEIFDV